MEVHVGVTSKPTIWLRLMRVEVVQDHVNLTPPVLCDHIVHEIQKLASPAPRIMAHLYLDVGDLQRGKQCTGAMSFVAVAESAEGLAVG
jgi:hypothetical protein